jgi:ABC-type glycerol-3-phosphate transport system substrate-binding protein
VEKSQYEENSFDSRYIEDRALLQPVTICKISNLTQQINGSIGEEIAYVGYPCENREGSCIKICGNGFVLSSKSDKLDGAWQFVRYYLTEDYQRNEMFDKGMPTRKDIFYEKAQSAAEYEGYCFINEEFVPLPPLTQEQIDAAVSFIEGLHNTAFEDEVIMKIIFEEAESFFNGNRTVEDVAKVIQNRVQLYLNEA